jgi:hypothetical protein
MTSMDDQPLRDPRLIEAMEACRPKSDDVSDPAMAPLVVQMAASSEVDALYERLQQIDSVVADAFRDVPVPAGLADRILARLAAAEAAGAVQPEIAAAQPAGAVVSAALCRQDVPAFSAVRPRGMRRTLVAIVAAAIAASIVTAFVVRRDDRKPVGAEVCEAAVSFFSADAARGHGARIIERVPPHDFPLSASVKPQRDMRWREVPDFLGHEAVAYDLAGRDGAFATVYVFSPDRVKLRDGQWCPTWQTGQQSSVAWREGQLVYVLVVQGGDPDQFLVDTSGPLT